MLAVEAQVWGEDGGLTSLCSYAGNQLEILIRRPWESAWGCPLVPWCTGLWGHLAVKDVFVL